MVKQISDNEIHLLIKYIKSILWRVTKRLSYIEDARCLNVKLMLMLGQCFVLYYISYICIVSFWSLDMACRLSLTCPVSHM